LAFHAVLRYYDVQYSKLSETVGKITAVFAKNLSQKAAAMRQNISTNLSGLPALKSGLPGELPAGTAMPAEVAPTQQQTETQKG
jgi:hypothetical protein